MLLILEGVELGVAAPGAVCWAALPAPTLPGLLLLLLWFAGLVLAVAVLVGPAALLHIMDGGVWGEALHWEYLEY